LNFFTPAKVSRDEYGCIFNSFMCFTKTSLLAMVSAGNVLTRHADNYDIIERLNVRARGRSLVSIYGKFKLARRDILAHTREAVLCASWRY
jgi:hypothetical protein